MKQINYKEQINFKIIIFFFLTIFLSIHSYSQELVNKNNLENYGDMWWYDILNNKEQMNEEYFLFNDFLINGSNIEFEDTLINVYNAVYIMKSKNEYFVLQSPSCIYDLNSGTIKAKEGIMTMYDLEGEFIDFIEKYEFKEIVFTHKDGKCSWKANKIQGQINKNK